MSHKLHPHQNFSDLKRFIFFEFSLFYKGKKYLNFMVACSLTIAFMLYFSILMARETFI